MQELQIKDPVAVLDYSPGQICALGHFFDQLDRDRLRDFSYALRVSFQSKGTSFKNFIRSLEEESVPIEPKQRQKKVRGFKMTTKHKRE